MEAVVEALLHWSRWAHGAVKEEIRGLEVEQLDFVPGPGTNSLGVLAAHIAGSETEIWSLVAGEPFTRSRPAEFVSRGASAADLVARLEAVDRLLVQLAPRIDQAKLAASVVRPNGEARPGLYWLVHSTSHVREHLGHVQLTKQLFPGRYPGLVKGS
jgi:hypothetical protein